MEGITQVQWWGRVRQHMDEGSCDVEMSPATGFMLPQIVHVALMLLHMSPWSLQVAAEDLTLAMQEWQKNLVAPGQWP